MDASVEAHFFVDDVQIEYQTGGDVFYGGTQIGTATGGRFGSALVVSLDVDATPAAVSALLQHVTYENTNTGTATPGLRTVTYSVDDGDGDTSTPTDAFVNVGNVNSPPMLLSNQLNLQEGETATITAVELSAADFDANDATLIFNVSSVQNGQFELSGSFTTSFTQADITAGIVTFVHDGGENAPSYSVTVTDGTNPVGPVAATITFANVNDAPVLTIGVRCGLTYRAGDNN